MKHLWLRFAFGGEPEQQYEALAWIEQCQAVLQQFHLPALVRVALAKMRSTRCGFCRPQTVVGSQLF